MKRINAIAAGILMVTIPLSAARFSTNATDAHLHLSLIHISEPTRL